MNKKIISDKDDESSIKRDDKVYEIEEMAELLFSEPPKESHTIRLINVEDNVDIYYQFEMILNLYMEGIFTLGFIDLNPWFHSIGININLIEHSIDEKDNLSNYYCKIIIKDDSKYTQWFEIKNIKKNYHFLNNSKFFFGYIEIKVFSKLYAIYIKDNILYKLSFNII